MVHFRGKIKGSLCGSAAVVCFALMLSCGGESADNKTTTQGKAASIEGFVRQHATAVAIAGAPVVVVSPSDRNQIRATTDADGHFLLDGLDAGRHLIAVVREGYVLPRQPNISGYPYQVDSNERLSNVVFHLVPSGTIAGRVFKADDKPANRVE